MLFIFVIKLQSSINHISRAFVNSVGSISLYLQLWFTLRHWLLIINSVLSLYFILFLMIRLTSYFKTLNLSPNSNITICQKLNRLKIKRGISWKTLKFLWPSRSIKVLSLVNRGTPNNSNHHAIVPNLNLLTISYVNFSFIIIYIAYI